MAKVEEPCVRVSTQMKAQQYRDMLIPSTLFAGLGLALFIGVLSTNGGLTWFWYLAAVCAVGSVVSSIVTLLCCHEALNSMEIHKKYIARAPAQLFFVVGTGVMLLLSSIVFLSFHKSTYLGILALLASLAGIRAYYWLMAHLDAYVSGAPLQQGENTPIGNSSVQAGGQRASGSDES